MSSQDQQQKLRVETNGDQLRSYLETIKPISTDYRLHIEPTDGLHVRCVDPANVCMVRSQLPESALNGFDGGRGITEGIPGKHLQNTLSLARKGRGNDTGDYVTLSHRTDGELNVFIDREDEPITSNTSIATIEPDSLRQEPEIQDLPLEAMARVDVSQLREVIQHVDTPENNHAHFSAESGDFVVGFETDTDSGDIRFEDRAGPIEESPELGSEGIECDGSLFSLDYLKDIVSGLHSANIETVTVQFGVECPCKFKFSHERLGFRGQYLLAPRIEQE